MQLFTILTPVLIATLTASSACGMNTSFAQTMAQTKQSCSDLYALASSQEKDNGESQYKLMYKFPLSPHKTHIGVKFSDDSKEVITFAGYTTVSQAWDINDGYLLYKSEGFESAPRTNLVFNKTKTKSLSCSSAEGTVIKSCASGAVLYTLPEQSITAAFNHDDSLVATISADEHTIKVWKLDTSKEDQKYLERILYERLRNEILHPTQAMALKRIVEHNN